METTKLCSKCQQTKTTDYFYKNKRRYDGLQGYCKVCDLAHANKNNYQSKKKHRQKKQDFVDTFRQNGCMYCDEKDICCLDFHHIDTTIKEEGISKMVRSGRSYANIEQELKKCDVVCSNCHRKLHAGRELVKHYAAGKSIII